MPIGNLSDHAFECYLQAGKAVAHTLKLGMQVTRPGTRLKDLATLLEADILDHGAEGLAFPANLGIDLIAAHYSPVIDDPLILPPEGLLKIDIGAHVEGYLADAAITINLGNTGGVHQTLMRAASEALYAAIGIAKPGVTVKQIGQTIQAQIQKYADIRPISNLGGHRVSQWDLHGAPFIPNVTDTMEAYTLVEGDQLAFEPFATNGFGSVKNGSKITIFEVKNIHIKKNLPQLERLRLQKFQQKFRNLPFSPRWIDFLPTDQISDTLLKYYRQGIIDGYHVFEERGNGLVTQFEHTVIITKDGAIPTTWWEDFGYKTLWQ